MGFVCKEKDKKYKQLLTVSTNISNKKKGNRRHFSVNTDSNYVGTIETSV